MWNITPNDVELAKEELKGRRAAIQARYDDETQKLKAELDDIEALERVATAFAQRHNREAAPASVEPDPTALPESLPIALDLADSAKEAECSDPQPDNHGEIGALPAAEALPFVADATSVQKILSRWRVRV